MPFDPAPAAAAREATFFSACSVALLSIPIEPLKSAPSSIRICAILKFPMIAVPDRRRRGLQRFDRNRQERNGAGGEECRLAGGSGWRGVERHLTIRDGEIGR